MTFVRTLTAKASDVYDTISFRTDQLYNDPAPEFYVAFIIGGVFSALGAALWVRRLQRIRADIVGPLTGSLPLRTMLSALIDNDEPIYTIIKMGAQSFLFLGGLQLNYEAAFSAMLGYFALESCFDSLRVILAFREANDSSDCIVTSRSLRNQLSNKTMTMQPTNVYEDIGRDPTIVGMVFITQCLLIAFVVSDIFDANTHTCHDGTSGCPIVGTLGSWCFYILGIFMACVFLLGPKTAFGQSEQNPAYWLRLLLYSKQTGTQATWNDPNKEQLCQRLLKPSDLRLWIRFFMSFLINGVGFHILVHALPIQVAGQSSLTGVVFRAVGMMYLVDLDDTPGYKITLVPKAIEDVTEETNETMEGVRPEVPKLGAGTMGTDDLAKPVLNDGEIATLSQQIIDDARAQLDALLNGGEVIPKQKTTGALAFAGGMRDRNEGAIFEHDDGGDGGGEEGGGEEGGGEEGGDNGGGMDE